MRTYCMNCDLKFRILPKAWFTASTGAAAANKTSFPIYADENVQQMDWQIKQFQRQLSTLTKLTRAAQNVER